MTNRLSLAVVLLAALAAPVFAQPDTPPAGTLPRADPTTLLPDGAVRVMRSLKLSWQVQDVPDVVFAKVQRVRDDGAQPEEIEGLFENPDTLTHRYSITLSPGSWFVSPEERANAFITALAAQEALKLPPPTGDIDGANLDYFAGRASLGDWMGRTLSAFSVTATWAQRPTFLNGVFLDPITASQDRTIRTISFKFDPITLMTSLDQYEAAFKAMDAYRKLYAKPSTVMMEAHACEGKRLSACLASASISRRMKVVTALLPTIELQSIDEFDFFKLGNRFLPYPEDDVQDGTLEALTFTWDLSRLFATAKDFSKGATFIGLKNTLAKPVPPPKPAVTGEK